MKKSVIVAIVVLLLANFAWYRTEYICDLTGRKMVVDRVFFMKVREAITDTDVSRWLDEGLGNSGRRIWGQVSRRSVYGFGGTGYLPRSQEAYDAFHSAVKIDDSFRNQLLESLKRDRKDGPTMPSSVPLTRGTPPAGQEPRHGSRSAHG
jgi:hypothetical protein